ncbi:hypothetical protein [Cellulomonas sp. KRMCY2]|uniref:hypothetical protein n=1 Tax=Cellulomonas sp. KRMCY2 TaxID=1304865 RepID=UPI00045E6D7F|nr:hypothetical protein [Cellulomonas sp. KRMCY2]
MPNPYDIGESSRAPRPEPSAGTRGGLRRPVLWVALAASAAANVVTSSVGINMLIGVGFGLLTLACVIALVVDHYSHATR